MRNMKRFIICALVLTVASVNVFADVDLKAQMQYNYDQDSEMGSFDLDEGDIAFTMTEDKLSYTMELEFADTTNNSEILELMYFDYAASDILGVKAGKFGSAFASWYGLGEKWGVEFYGSFGVLGYQLDIVNGTGDKFAIQPVLTLTPVDALTLSFDGNFDLGDDTNNAVAATADLSVLDGWIYSEAYYNLDSENYKALVEVGYDLTDTITAEANVMYNLDNSAVSIGSYVDFTALPVNIKPGVGYNLSDDSTVNGNYSVYVEFEYDFSL